jgi:hypothetical protein
MGDGITVHELFAGDVLTVIVNYLRVMFWYQELFTGDVLTVIRKC